MEIGSPTGVHHLSVGFPLLMNRRKAGYKMTSLAQTVICSAQTGGTIILQIAQLMRLRDMWYYPAFVLCWEARCVR